ncbi:hypothetical protein VNO78_28499 [Psophocarpus tetragonolobus]|uniref:Uncharacterized protein n=1 Tax=Psophocarpus tetragonolobus TaxID=3891 RepID=A0AAN9S4R3_PSOTE
MGSTKSTSVVQLFVLFKQKQTTVLESVICSLLDLAYKHTSSSVLIGKKTLFGYSFHTPFMVHLILCRGKTTDQVDISLFVAAFPISILAGVDYECCCYYCSAVIAFHCNFLLRQEYSPRGISDWEFASDIFFACLSFWFASASGLAGNTADIGLEQFADHSE